MIQYSFDNYIRQMLRLYNIIIVIMICDNYYCSGADVIQFSILYDIVMIDRLCGCVFGVYGYKIQFIILADMVSITMLCSVWCCVKWLWVLCSRYVVCMYGVYSIYVYSIWVVCRGVWCGVWLCVANATVAPNRAYLLCVFIEFHKKIVSVLTKIFYQEKFLFLAIPADNCCYQRDIMSTYHRGVLWMTL